MSVIFFKGGAVAVQQVDDFTPANVGVGDIFTLTSTGEDGSTVAIAFTATGATVANVTAGLVALWNASTNPLCSGVTATDNTTKLTLAADTAGVPFSVASTTTDGNASNTQTLTRAAVTANKGSKDFNTALNWSGGVVPTTGDTVIFDGRMQNALLYGLNQSGVTLAVLQTYKSRRFAIGTSTAALKISATLLDHGVDAGDGSSVSEAFSNIYTGTNACTASYYSTGGNGSEGLSPAVIMGHNAGNAITVYGGNVGLGTAIPGAAGTWATVKVEGGTLGVGTGVTITNLTQSGGTVNWAGVTISGTLTATQGRLNTSGVGSIATLTASQPGPQMALGHRTASADVATFNWDGGSLDLTVNAATFICTATALKRCGSGRILSNTQWTRGTTTTDFSNGSNLSLITG